MPHTESPLMRLNKEDLVRMLLGYQGKLNNILDELKSNFNELKNKFCKLESHLHISRNVNDKLSDRLGAPEQKCHANEWYSRMECLKILGIHAEVGNKDIEEKVLEILDAINAPVNPELVEDCNPLPSKGSPKNAILKVNLGKDAR